MAYALRSRLATLLIAALPLVQPAFVLPAFGQSALGQSAHDLSAPGQVPGKQDPDGLASLQADVVEVSGDNLLTATGDVEVRWRGQILRARAVRYDRSRDHLSITGPITVTDESGNLITAGQAELSGDLSQGLLHSARFVIDRQMQIAARQMWRSQGRYTELTDSVASSCEVCTIAPRPLWEIRAARVVHDQVAQQLWFERAQLRFAGVPVAWLPQLRVPDPTLDRARGLLSPRLRTTTGLGPGLKLPYFIPLGETRDLTVTPYASLKGGRTVELRYREAFRRGWTEWQGAWSRDEILPQESRYYLQADGGFLLPDSFVLGFSGILVSDPTYLTDYGISDADRLESRIEVSRARRNEYIMGRLVNFRSIRDIGGMIEPNATLPSLTGDFTYHRRFSGGPLGGEAGFRFQSHSHYRSSDLDYDADGDGIADGRDMARISARIDWRRSWIFGPGVVGSLFGEGSADLYSINQDRIYEGRTARLQGAMAGELRWPWTGVTADGASHVIEPVLQIVGAPRGTGGIPNEDSLLVEFDEGNLFSLSRFSGADAREQGRWANLGLSWTRFDPEGWSLALGAGRVVRSADEEQFPAASGLDGRRSDWLAVGQVVFPDGFSTTSRMLISDGMDLTKAELRLDLDREDYGLAGSFVWLEADERESRLTDTRELYLDGRYRFSPAWNGYVSGRYDIEANRINRSDLGLEFRNECLRVDLSLSRRFISSTSVNPTTSVGVSVDLLGFGGSGASGPSRTCRG